MAKIPVGLRFDPEMITAIDAARGKMPRTRWIEAAIRRRLAATELAPPGVADLERAIHDAELGSTARAVTILRTALSRARAGS
jgi:hypothetical protein